MAEVWEGRDDVLSRPVAVKILLPHLAADPQLRERFRREAVTAARLVHPGIVAIFDAGVEAVDASSDTTTGGSLRGAWPRDADRAFGGWPETPSLAFIIMELVPGETLRDLIRASAPLEPRLAVGIASQVTDALAYAHAQGLVHRDIKPANVLLRDEGAGLVQVKVADFGIAKATASTGDLTSTGALLGTPKYVSPEQVQGREPDARADLYSLGVVLFEMLAGKAPFQGGADMATALAHVQRPAPSLAQVRPDLPRGLPELVAALLVKEPEDRVPSAPALASSLAELGRRLGFPAGGPGAFLYLGSGASQAGRGRTAPAGTTALERTAKRTEASGQQTTKQAGAAGAGAVGAGAVGAGAAGAGVSGSRRRSRAASRAGDQGSARTVAEAARTMSGEVWAADEAAAGAARRKRPKRFATLMVAALVIAGGLVAGALLYQGKPADHSSSNGKGTSSSGQTAATASRYQAIDVVAEKEVAVGGNLPNDNIGELPNLVSSDPSTFWQSDQYHGQHFGNYGGLGVALELNGAHVLHDLVVKTPMQGWGAEVFLGNSFSSTLTAWGRAISVQQLIDGDHTFYLGGKRASWVLLWMLNPGPTDQATIDKLSVR